MGLTNSIYLTNPLTKQIVILREPFCQSRYLEKKYYIVYPQNISKSLNISIINVEKAQR